MKSIMIIIKESAKLAKIAGSSVNCLAALDYSLYYVKEIPKNHGSTLTSKIAECTILQHNNIII